VVLKERVLAASAQVGKDYAVFSSIKNFYKSLST
jgi:hypothetical protein